MLAKASEDLINMGDMFFEGVGVDKNVMKVNDVEEVEIIAETIIGISFIGKIKGHDGAMQGQRETLLGT